MTDARGDGHKVRFSYKNCKDRCPLPACAAAGLIVLLKGLQVLNKWQENWIFYRATCEGLRNEQHLYAEKAGPYAGLKPPRRGCSPSGPAAW